MVAQSGSETNKQTKNNCRQNVCFHPCVESSVPGCVYGGEEHSEGSSWFADSTPCMTCMCADGVTTCSEVRCLSPCINFINVPGECCPVCAGRSASAPPPLGTCLLRCRRSAESSLVISLCADCVFEGRVYGPGDSFHPANDPCQICTCEVPHMHTMIFFVLLCLKFRNCCHLTCKF